MPFLLILGGIFLYIYCEISLLVNVGSYLGVFPLILLLIAISVGGLWLIKVRGLFTVLEIRKQIASGKIPTDALISSLLFAIAGILLIVPGFLSDILAILVMLPGVRTLVKGYLLKYFSGKISVFRFSGFQRDGKGRDTVFDAEFERRQDDDKWIK